MQGSAGWEANSANTAEIRADAGTSRVVPCASCGRVSGHATFASDRGLCHRCERFTITMLPMHGEAEPS